MKRPQNDDRITAEALQAAANARLSLYDDKHPPYAERFARAARARRDADARAHAIAMSNLNRSK